MLINIFYHILFKRKITINKIEGGVFWMSRVWLTKINFKATINVAVASASDLDVGEGVFIDGILRQMGCYLVPSSDPVSDVRRRGLLGTAFAIR